MNRLFTGRLTVESLNIAIADLPEHLHGTKLVQLSDFHYEYNGLSDKLLEEAIAISNELQPDLIVLTGDYVTENASCIYNLIKKIKYLESRVGIYAILGNHDLFHRGAKTEIINALNSIDIKVLWNQVAYPFGPKLALVGLADFYSQHFQPNIPFQSIAPNIPRIVLSHNPDSAKSLQKWRVDLQLSGHTHGGQIVLPGIGPIIPEFIKFVKDLPKPIRDIMPYVKRRSKIIENWQWAQGLHQLKGDSYLYVNRGLGSYFPGRLFCPPEVTLITLLRKK